MRFGSHAGGYMAEVCIGPAEILVGPLPDVQLHRWREARKPRSRLPHHQLGRVETREESASHPRSEHREQNAGAEPQLEHPVTGPRTYELDHPIISWCIDPLHCDGKHPAADAARSHRLADSESAHRISSLLPTHMLRGRLEVSDIAVRS